MRKTLPLAACALVFGMAFSLDAQQTSPGDTVTYALETWTPLESQVIKGQPYSAEVVSEQIQLLSDGNRIVRRTTGRVYRDVDGRVRREEDAANGIVNISIMDAVANVTYTLNPQNRTARQHTGLIQQFSIQSRSLLAGDFWSAFQNMKPTAQGGRGGSTTTSATETQRPRAGRGAPGGGGGGRGAATPTVATASTAVVTENLPAKSVEGVNATGIRRTRTIPAGTIGNERDIAIVSEEWTSTELQVLVLTTHSDPRSGTSTYKLSNIRRTGQDPNLFKVPADYTITTTGRGGARR